MLPRRRLFGLDFVDLDSLDPVVDELVAYEPVPWDGGEPLPCVVTPNVDLVVKVDQGRDEASNRVFAGARWVLPDGQPVVWASRLLRAPLRARLTGSDLVTALWPRLAEEGRRTLVVAPSAEIARRVEADSPLARAVVAPILGSDATAMASFVEECHDEVRSHRPSHVFVTLGFPKPYQLMDGLLDRAAGTGEPVPVLIAIGAAFEMHYGLVARAPRWMQRWGLEWLHRLAKEPRRLFHRYVVEDPAFVRIVWRERSERRRRAVASD